MRIKKSNGEREERKQDREEDLGIWEVRKRKRQRETENSEPNKQKDKNGGNLRKDVVVGP